jgi:hypothetical protein
MKLRENGELISPKVAPERTDPIAAKRMLSMMRGSLIFELIRRIAMGITVEIVKIDDPLRRLMREENVNIMSGMNVYGTDRLERNLIIELENPSLRAIDSTDSDNRM